MGYQERSLHVLCVLRVFVMRVGAMNQLSIGLIGAGRIGRVHAENITFRIPEARLLMVADVVEQAARDCAQRYGIASVSGDYRDVLENREIQAIAICSATDTHTQIIEDAALAGRQ